MKNPLRYQLTEYDCGPASMLNAISYLFERKDIPPEVIRNIMLYCLDCHSKEGVPGKRGTSRAAMAFLCNWLNEYGELGLLPISGEHIIGNGVCIGAESRINYALCHGGVAVVRLYLDEPHYVQRKTQFGCLIHTGWIICLRKIFRSSRIIQENTIASYR